MTIPKPLRDRLGIKPGEILSVSADGGRLVFTKQSARDEIDEVAGILGTAIGDVDEFVREIRGPDYQP